MLFAGSLALLSNPSTRGGPLGANQAAELRDHLSPCRVGAKHQAGNGNHQQQQWRQREQRVVQPARRPCSTASRWTTRSPTGVPAAKDWHRPVTRLQRQRFLDDAWVSACRPLLQGTRPCIRSSNFATSLAAVDGRRRLVFRARRLRHAHRGGRAPPATMRIGGGLSLDGRSACGLNHRLRCSWTWQCATT